MAKVATKQEQFRHTWFLREWMALAGKRQVDLQKELEWPKGKANAIWHGQQYTQQIMDQVAPWLNARPYEMLMDPAEAMAIRRLREDAARIVADTPQAPAASNVRRIA